VPVAATPDGPVFAKDAPTMQLRLRVAHRTVAALLVMIATFSALLESFARRLRAMKKDAR
jgi:hypothetical protein